MRGGGGNEIDYMYSLIVLDAVFGFLPNGFRNEYPPLFSYYNAPVVC